MNVHSKMAAHHAAFMTSAALVGFDYARREAPSLESIKKAQDIILTAFEAFKAANDKRLEEIESKGQSDPLTAEQVDRIAADITALKEIRDELDQLQRLAARPGGAGASEEQDSPEAIEHRTAFINFMRNPDDAKAAAAAQAAYKAVETGSPTAGGHAVPEIISRRINRLLTEISPLRNLVDVVDVGSPDYKELVDILGASYGWVGEKGKRGETRTPQLEEIAPTFGMLYAYPKATEESLSDMFFNVERWIINSALEAFSAGEEAAIVNGDGNNKPTGLLHAAPDVKGDLTRPFGRLQFLGSGAAKGFADENPADAINRLIYSLKKGYRKNARFLMNRATAGEVMLFKDGQGNYLWQPSSTLGQPDRLRGYGVAESEEMPDVSANAFPIAFGDFKAGYLLCPLVGLRITRDEITAPGYVKWYLRRRLGGCVKKSEAIKLLKIAA